MASLSKGAADRIIELPFQHDEKLLAVVLQQFPFFVARAVFDEKRIHGPVGFFECQGEIMDTVFEPLIPVDLLPFVQMAEHIFGACVFASEQLDHIHAERGRHQIQRPQRSAGPEIFKP
jgi:hypothetical protein